MESRLSFRLADPADAELLGRLNFQLIRFPGLRPFTGAGEPSKQQVIDLIPRLSPRFPAIYFLLFIICAFSRVDGILS